MATKALKPCKQTLSLFPSTRPPPPPPPPTVTAMWRSRARALLLLRSSAPRPPPPLPPPRQTLTLTRPPCPRPPAPLRFLSTSLEPIADAGEPAEEKSAASADEESATSVDGGDDSLSSLWEDGGNAHADAIFASAASPEADAAADEEEVARVRSVVEATPEEQMGSALADMAVDFTEPLVRAVLQELAPLQHCSGKKMLLLFKYACKNNPAASSLANLECVVNKIDDSEEIDKMDAYLLGDFVKELGITPGSVSTGVLNRMIAMFCKLGKAKAGLEVFEMFREFGLSPDGDSYFLTIEAAGKRSMINAAWGICEKMISSGCFPDGEKAGKIVTFLCKGKKLKEAHLAYLAAKEKKVSVPTSALTFLLGALARNDETIGEAAELLADFHGESLKYAGKSFAAVIHGLCRTNNLQEARKLLMRMVNLGPPPGSAVFNFVITALSKAGEMEDAKGLMRVMESRGLCPDVYTYSVVMSGYTKGSMMDEAHKLLHEAKKKHPKLSRVTYHILIRGYCKMQEFEKALECLKEMKEDGLQPNMDEYNKLIQSLCLKAMDWRAAEKILKEMEDSGLHLKGTTRSLIAAVKELEEEEIQPNASSEA